MSLSPSTTYYFRVKAVNSETESDFSEVMSVTTLPDNNLLANEPAATPIIYTILPGSNKADILILPSTGDSITEYKVTVSTNSDFSSPLLNKLTYVLDTNTTYAHVSQIRYIALTVGNLAPATLYYIRIAAVNTISTSGNASTTFSTFSTVAIPTALGVTNLTSITATVNWIKVNNATSYVLDLDDNVNFSSPVLNGLDVGNNDSYAVPVLVENTTYYFRVRAKNSSILSSNSNIISFTTLDSTNTYNPLSFDLNVSSITGIKNLDTTSFQVTWNNVTGAISYTVDISSQSNFGSILNTGTTFDTKYSFSGLNPGAVYYVRVKANNTAKSSLYASQTVTTTTNNINLSVPQALVPNIVKSTAFAFNWVKRNYATRYKIELSTNIGFSTIIQTIYTGDVDSIVFQELTPVTAYYVRIAALNTFEISNFSNIVSATTSAALPVINLNATTNITAYSVSLNWDINSAYTGYKLNIYKYIAGLGNQGFSFLGNGFFADYSVGNTNNYTIDVFLEPNTTYKYFITGITATNETKDSSIGTFSTRAQAPIIQISGDGNFLTWSGDLTRLEVSSDKQFKNKLQGWNPRIVENTGSYNISNITTNAISYWIRGYTTISSLEGMYSKEVSTVGTSPLFTPTSVTDTTAYIYWKKNTSSNYSVQVMVENTGNYIPVSGYNFPVNIGDVDSLYIQNLTPNTNYKVLLYYFSNIENRYVLSDNALYFTTNRYSSSSSINTSGSAITATVSNILFDRFTLYLPTNDTYVIDISRRADFLDSYRYIEVTGISKEIVVDANNTYYLKVSKIVGVDKTTPQNITVVMSNIPDYGSSLSTGTTLSPATIINETEAILTWSILSNATGYTVEVSETNTFNLLVNTSYIKYLDSNRVLLSGLVGTKLYYVRVYGFNDNSISNYSNVVTIDTTP